jgi:hypothetical protein
VLRCACRAGAVEIRSRASAHRGIIDRITRGSQDDATGCKANPL